MLVEILIEGAAAAGPKRSSYRRAWPDEYE
jgi:hypothetical protein